MRVILNGCSQLCRSKLCTPLRGGRQATQYDAVAEMQKLVFLVWLNNMTDYELACAISTIICSYRKGELSKPLDHNHVLKWVGQFDEEDRSVILEETLHILTRQYYSREAIEDSVDGILCKIREQVGSFEDIIFVNPQEQGSSQKILYTIISEKRGAEFRGQCAEFTESSKIYVYIDDGLYTGGRARTDLTALIERLPPNSRLYVFYLFAYSNACS